MDLVDHQQSLPARADQTGDSLQDAGFNLAGLVLDALRLIVRGVDLIKWEIHRDTSCARRACSESSGFGTRGSSSSGKY